jgi:hypothetical protein
MTLPQFVEENFSDNLAPAPGRDDLRLTDARRWPHQRARLPTLRSDRKMFPRSVRSSSSAPPVLGSTP